MIKPEKLLLWQLKLLKILTTLLAASLLSLWFLFTIALVWWLLFVQIIVLIWSTLEAKKAAKKWREKTEERYSQGIFLRDTEHELAKTLQEKIHIWSGENIDVKLGNGSINAFVLDGNRMLITEGLLEKPELVKAVVAHESAHVRANHWKYRIVLDTLLENIFQVLQGSRIRGLFALLSLSIVPMFIGGYWAGFVSQCQEHEADLLASLMLEDTKTLIEALRSEAMQGFSAITHPSNKRRVRLLRLQEELNVK